MYKYSTYSNTNSVQCRLDVYMCVYMHMHVHVHDVNDDVHVHVHVPHLVEELVLFPLSLTLSSFSSSSAWLSCWPVPRSSLPVKQSLIIIIFCCKNSTISSYSRHQKKVPVSVPVPFRSVPFCYGKTGDFFPSRLARSVPFRSVPFRPFSLLSRARV